MDTQARKILVLGADSAIGRELVREIRSLGTACLAGVQGPQMPGYGTDSVVLDYLDPTQLAHAMHGLDCVVVPTFDCPDARARHDSILDAAIRADVGHVMRISTLGADIGSTNEWLKLSALADQRLRLSSICYSIFECAPFMQRLFGHLTGSDSGLLRLHLPVGSGRTAWLDLRDVAACILERVHGQNLDPMTYQLSGRQLLDGEQVALGMSQALDSTVVYLNTPEQAYLAQRAAQGLSPQELVWEQDYFRAIRDGEYELPYGDIYRLLMSPPTTFSVFTTRHVERRSMEFVNS